MDVSDRRDLTDWLVIRDLVYSFQECIEGESLGQRHDKLADKIELTEKDKTTIRSLAKHFLDLEKITFNSFGSLHPTSTTLSLPTFDNSTEDPQIVVGPFVRYFPTSPFAPYFSGPFPTAKAMYLTYIDHLLTQTKEGKRYAPAYESESYLILLEARSMVEGCKELEEGLGYIKHGDDKGDHFMVDPSGALTSVIDWEWLVASPSRTVLISQDVYNIET
jgi:hypothetical protein